MLVIYTTIRNTMLNDMEGVPTMEKLMLRECQRENAQVQVLSLECDPGYYNVKLPNGTVVTGLHWYHLEGFTCRGVDVSAL